MTDEFDAFLACGILAHGFLRLRCNGCAEEKLVAFLCKRRGICPSCGTRRMHEAAAQLVDHVIPTVPVRQWVLSFPIPLRSLFAVHPECLLPPTTTAPALAGDCAHTQDGSATGRMRWAQMLKRVFDIDIERCAHCGGQLKLIAAIEEPVVIERILTHLGLAAQPPPRAPARRVDLLQVA